MKKSVLLFAIVIATVFGATAQDTIDMLGQQREGYLYSHDYYGYVEGVSVSIWGGFGNGGDVGKYFSTDDSLTIYGIAIGVTDGVSRYRNLEYYYSLIHDTSNANAYEYVRLYEPYPNSLRCIRQQIINVRQSPIAYVASYHNTLHPNDPISYVNMYERYFDTPATVVDSFYVGMSTSNTSLYIDNDGNRWEYSRIPLMIQALGNFSHITRDTLMFYATNGAEWVRATYDGSYMLVFPILLPPDTVYASDTTNIGGDTLIVNDTTIIGTDTIVTTDTLLAIADTCLLGHLIGVVPNPASATARVVSSVGISRIEAFDLSGRKVDDVRVPDSSLSVTLDVDHWTQGTYILRIHTPMGIVSKKLVVRQ